MRNYNSISLLTLMLLTWYLSFHVQVRAVEYIDANSATIAPPFGAMFSYSTYSLPTSISAGDFNDDGFEDLLIGLGSNDIALVVFGTPTGIPQLNLPTIVTPTQGIKISGTTGSTTDLGFAVEGVGDVNGDGVDDIMVGDNDADIVYVIFGKSGVGNFNALSFTASQGIKITGTSGENFGKVVGLGGDLNKDGINDMLIGAPTGSKAYVIFGNKNGLSNMNANSLTTDQGFKITGVASSSFGSSVSRAGDVNGDGVEDFMIGAEMSKDMTDTITGAGMVGIFYGRNTSTPVTDYVATSIDSNQGCLVYGYFASSRPIGKVNTIGPAGDINNDNIDDVMIGNPDFYNIGGIGGDTLNGKVLILYGKEGGVCSSPINFNTTTSNQGFTIIGYGASYQLGIAVTSGDINHDGYTDLILGAFQATSSYGAASGKVYVFFGTKEPFSDIDMKAGEITYPRTLFYYGTASSGLGKMVEAAKDIDGDGINDIIASQAGAQKLLLFYGSQCNSAEVCSASMHPICYASRGCLCGDNGKKVQGQSCVDSCTDGYYLDQTNPICESCPAGCLTCSGATTCQSCNSTLLLQGTSCVASCSPGYKEGEGRTCVVDGSTQPGNGGGETTPGGGENGGGETTPGGGENGGGETTPGGGENGGGETTPGGNNGGSGSPQAGGENSTETETITSESSKAGMIVGITVGSVVLVGITAFIYKRLIIAKLRKATSVKNAPAKSNIEVIDREEAMRLERAEGDIQSVRNPEIEINSQAKPPPVLKVEVDP